MNEDAVVRAGGAEQGGLVVVEERAGGAQVVGDWAKGATRAWMLGL